MDNSQAYAPVKMEVKSTKTLGKVPTKYHANENATRIVNIQYKKYIKKMTAPTDCVIPSISEFFSPEENEYWDLPCYSLLIRYAENIDYKGLRTVPRECSTLQEIYMD